MTNVRSVRGGQGARGLEGVQEAQGVRFTPGARSLEEALDVRFAPGARGLEGAQGVEETQGVQEALDVRFTPGARGLEGALDARSVLGLRFARGVHGLRDTLGRRFALGRHDLRDALGLRSTRGLPSARGVRRGLAVPLLAALLTGCGIRATEVPTDFGPAPSRVPCSLSDVAAPSASDAAAQSARGVPVQVFLLCASQLVTVDRSVRVPDGTGEAERRVLVAQGLLDELAETPSADETEAGYTTDVRDGMSVTGPGPQDPEDTLRLSTSPDDLASYALAQIVCTFSDSAAAEGDGSVVLGGPNTTPLRRYACTPEVRSRPGAQVPPSSDVNGS